MQQSPTAAETNPEKNVMLSARSAWGCDPRPDGGSRKARHADYTGADADQCVAAGPRQVHRDNDAQKACQSRQQLAPVQRFSEEQPTEERYQQLLDDT